MRDTYEEFKALRAVLDSASESSFLYSAAAHILGLKRERNLDILDKTLKRFWEIEEVETTEVYSDELKYCNDHFEKTHLRKPDGKFVVEMPFKPDSSEGILGNSKAIASKMLDQ
ncbi:integrase catalytic domain-containing protein [Trichonephila clavipes]|nr:integrase catalytic domain-containing protein [Trichonephila clavipes]